jgi:hypothetical protein
VRSCTGKESRRLLCASRPLQGSEKAYRPHPGPSSNPARPLSAHHHHSPPPTPAPSPPPSSVELPGQRELPLLLLLLPQCLLSPASRWTARATLFPSPANPRRCSLLACASGRCFGVASVASCCLTISSLRSRYPPPGPHRSTPAPDPHRPRLPYILRGLLVHQRPPPPSRSPPYCGETS